MLLQITECHVDSVNDFDSLMHAIATGEHDIDLADFEQRLNLPEAWDWETVLAQIEDGELTAQEVDNAIHRGLR